MPDEEPRVGDAITVQLFGVDGLDWPNLDQTERDAIASAIRDSALLGPDSRRFGFVDVEVQGAAVLGWFAHEHPAIALTYDATKQSVRQEVVTTERVLFGLSETDGLCGLQARRFPAETGLTMDTVRQRFIQRLKDVMRELGYDGLDVRPLKADGFDKAAAWKLLTERRVISLDVDDIAGSALDPNYPVFNPDKELNDLYAEHIWPRTRENVDRVEMKASEGGNLGKTREARGLVSAARTREIVVEADGHTETFQSQWNGRVEVQVPSPGHAAEFVADLQGRVPANVDILVRVVPPEASQPRLI